MHHIAGLGLESVEEVGRNGHVEPNAGQFIVVSRGCMKYGAIMSQLVIHHE